MRRGGNGTQCDRNLSTPDLWECAPPLGFLVSLFPTPGCQRVSSVWPWVSAKVASCCLGGS